MKERGRTLTTREALGVNFFSSLSRSDVPVLEQLANFSPGARLAVDSSPITI